MGAQHLDDYHLENKTWRLKNGNSRLEILPCGTIHIANHKSSLSILSNGDIVLSSDKDIHLNTDNYNNGKDNG